MGGRLWGSPWSVAGEAAGPGLPVCPGNLSPLRSGHPPSKEIPRKAEPDSQNQCLGADEQAYAAAHSSPAQPVRGHAVSPLLIPSFANHQPHSQAREPAPRRAMGTSLALGRGGHYPALWVPNPDCLYLAVGPPAVFTISEPPCPQLHDGEPASRPLHTLLLGAHNCSGSGSGRLVFSPCSRHQGLREGRALCLEGDWHGTYKHIENSTGKAHLLKGHAAFTRAPFVCSVVGIGRKQPAGFNTSVLSRYPWGRGLCVFPPYGLMGGLS